MTWQSMQHLMQHKVCFAMKVDAAFDAIVVTIFRAVGNASVDVAVAAQWPTR